MSVRPWDYIICDSGALEITGLQIIDALAELRSNAQLLIMQQLPSPIFEAIEAHAAGKKVSLRLLNTASSNLQQVEKHILSNPQAKNTSELSATDAVDFNQTSPLECLEQIVAYYQPQICLGSGRLYGAEALARWDLKELGVFGPLDILPVLKTAPLREALWERMLDHATDTLKRLQGAELNIAVNICADIARSVNWSEDLAQRFQRSNIRTQNFTVEITESPLHEAQSWLTGTVAQLRLRGFHCAIDDFGTGFSSLQRLATTPFNKLKIDKGFVQRARSSNAGKKLLHNTVMLAHDLGLLVIAEGIETKEDYERAGELGIDIAQGYYFAKPMPFNDFMKYALSHTEHFNNPASRLARANGGLFE
ncbi:EAL domain-containing protein [uncultured Pseudomonas sp.]|uniref:EAL domain-containing protein n=1 Tax=uncultured Pseudomonas sp. TaxID=114707 RepID=UPI002595C7C8|nr:EAL domain-containing protein [uncultured Pseudomonas sp.]